MASTLLPLQYVQIELARVEGLQADPEVYECRCFERHDFDSTSLYPQGTFTQHAGTR